MAAYQEFTRQFKYDPVSSPHSIEPPSHTCSHEENIQLQAYLYSLTTPNMDHTTPFGSDHERICFDSGASVCISTKCENFIKLNKVEHPKSMALAPDYLLKALAHLSGPFVMTATMK